MGLRSITSVMFVVMVAALIPGATLPVIANDGAVKDSTDREAVLGTFHIGPKSDEGQRRGFGRTQARPRGDRLVPEFSDLSTKHLLHVFANANDALQNGDRATAQRLYERVIAARPNSRLADAARKELATLYRDPARQPERATHDQGGALDRGDRQDQDDAVYGPHRPTTARKALHPDGRLFHKRQRSRRVVMLERQFIAEVGDRVFFPRGSAALGTRARDVLAQQAAWLHRYPDLVVTVEGHADDGMKRRNAHYELALSRAEAVRRGLVNAGVSASRITTKSFGREDPVAGCDSVQCAAQNRRVVTVIADGPVRTARETVPAGDRRFSDSAVPAPSPPQFERSGRLPARAFR